MKWVSIQLRAGAVGMTVAIALASCGGSSTRSSSRATRSATSSSSTSAATSSPAAGQTIPIATFALPSAAAGCHGATSAGGTAMRIPARVSKIGPDVGIVVNVCIEGHGPFPFLLDTGAASASITPALADRLKLPKVGKVETISGAGCSEKGQERRISAWRVGGIALHAQTATAQYIPHFGGPGQPEGLIGADVWNAFGALRIDFRHSDLVVPGPEHALPTKETLIKKPSSAPVPSALLKGHPQIVAPMRVDAAPGQTLALVSVAFGAHAKTDFLPDTGASTSAVDSSLAKQMRLAPTDIKARTTTACSVVTLPKVASGSWAIAGHPLAPQPLVVANFTISGPFAGLFGADQMYRYGSVIIDYRGGRLILGAG